MNILYQDNAVLVVDKPAGMAVFREGHIKDKTVMDELVERYPELKEAGEAPRYGAVHRLDRDTSGVLLVAKTPEALLFLQKQFRNRGVGKKYLALVVGRVKDDTDTIHTLMGRSPAEPRKQKVFSLNETHRAGLREAITRYQVQRRFEGYTLLEVAIATGRRHQIRCHMAHMHHPVAGDPLYGFKDSPVPEGLHRQFLHAWSVTIMLPDGDTQTFSAPLPNDLQNVLSYLKP